MINPIIQRISEVIRIAIDEAPFVVKPALVGWVAVDQNDKVHFTDNDVEKVDEECDRLNDLYVTFKAIEGLRGDFPPEVYTKYKCDKQWKDLNSVEVWNLWLDAILSDV